METMIKVPKQSEILNMGFIYDRRDVNSGAQVFKAPKEGHTSGVAEIEFVPRLFVKYYDSKGIYHNTEGAAIIHNGGYSFYIHGNLHRYDGPARHSAYATWWYLHGSPIKSDEYKSWLIDMGMDIYNLSENDKILIDLKWKPT